MSTARKHLSPSIAIAFCALFVALSGAAIALPGTNKVDSGDIKNGAVKAKDLAPTVRTQISSALASTTTRSRVEKIEWTNGCPETEFPVFPDPIFSKSCSGIEEVTIECRAGEVATGGGYDQITPPPLTPTPTLPTGAS